VTHEHTGGAEELEFWLRVASAIGATVHGWSYHERASLQFPDGSITQITGKAGKTILDTVTKPGIYSPYGLDS
jgi:hypothetical protein